ncbi:MAG: signal peptidase II [Spirochaetes bacterium]|jgi:signal peptidase II|nr:signal peptidase II [Spirochaetota bacterium]
MKKHAIAAGIFSFSLALDIVTKVLAVRHIGLHERIDVLGSFVQLTLLYNRGGLFGILQGYQSFFLVVSVLVLALLVVYYALEKQKTPLFCNAMALVMSGAVGNILDRVTGRPGVVDFIYIGDDAVFRWPAFNVADAAIVIGALLLLLFYYREEKRRKAEESAGQ